MTNSTLGSQFLQKTTNNETNARSWSFRPLTNFSERETTQNAEMDNFYSEPQSPSSPNSDEIAKKHLQKVPEDGKKLENNPNLGLHESF